MIGWSRTGCKQPTNFEISTGVDTDYRLQCAAEVVEFVSRNLGGVAAAGNVSAQVTLDTITGLSLIGDTGPGANKQLAPYHSSDRLVPTGYYFQAIPSDGIHTRLLETYPSVAPVMIGVQKSWRGKVAGIDGYLPTHALAASPTVVGSVVELMNSTNQSARIQEVATLGLGGDDSRAYLGMLIMQT
jgi:hypothetical protein